MTTQKILDIILLIILFVITILSALDDYRSDITFIHIVLFLLFSRVCLTDEEVEKLKSTKGCGCCRNV